MADIALVIKISKDDYKEVKEDTYSGTPFENRVFSAIANGTPLDKHDEEVIKETVESIWGKPPYTELLDKIRAEIIQERDGDMGGSQEIIDGFVYGCNRALDIIDKYRKEQDEHRYN